MLKQLFFISAMVGNVVVASPAAAASSSSSSNPTPTASGAVTTHTVSVGKADHKMDPESLTANPGDVVKFEFYPRNHSVVRQNYNFPCVPYEMTTTPEDKAKAGAWWSGFMPMQEFLSPAPSHSITINDTNPLYYYCSAPGSCIDYEMVVGINPENDSMVPNLKIAAGKASYALSPGEPFPSEGETPGRSDSSTSANNSNGISSSSNGSVTLSAGAIAGIAIGGVATLALIGLLFFFIGRKKKGAEMKSAIAGPANAQETGLMAGQNADHPPMYGDARYSMQPVSPGWDITKTPVSGAGSPHQQQQDGGSDMRMSDHPNRVSELPDSSAHSPVEIYTPGPGETR